MDRIVRDGSMTGVKEKNVENIYQNILLTKYFLWQTTAVVTTRQDIVQILSPPTSLLREFPQIGITRGGSGRGWAGQFSPPYGNTMFHIVAKLGLIGYTCATSPSVTFLLFRCRSGLEMTCQLTYNTYRGGGEEEGGVEEKKILIMRYLHSRSKLKIEMKINFQIYQHQPFH